MELISKKKVVEIINRHKCDTSEIILGVIELPTVEAKEVVHGEWKTENGYRLERDNVVMKLTKAEFEKHFKEITK